MDEGQREDENAITSIANDSLFLRKEEVHLQVHKGLEMEKF